MTVPAKVEQGQTALEQCFGTSQSTNHSQRYWKGQKEPTALLIGRRKRQREQPSALHLETV